MSHAYHPAPLLNTLPNEDGAPFFDPVKPASFPDAIVRFRNQNWANKVGLGDLSETEWITHFARFEPLSDNLLQPLAIRYHGHQFRHYNHEIGDGRGFLFAQLRDADGRLLDLGTKGSGTTPYSRTGDGRLTLKGGIREILATEMLEALGVYTSKTFSVIETGEALYRGDEPSPTRSCVLTRLSHSHVRFGVFQRLAYEENADAISALISYCCHHYGLSTADDGSSEQVLSFYASVIRNSARLTAQWMAAGFVHGVLNTDNMNVTGESFDYGPWRFIPTLDPGFTAAYFDQTGLYAYGRQGEATGWNLAQLGGTLTLLADTEALTEELKVFPAQFEDAMTEAFFQRLGIKRSTDASGDHDFLQKLIGWLHENQVPFEQFIFDWFCGRTSERRANSSKIKDHYESETFMPLREKLVSFTPVWPERLDHPYFSHSSPCTMLIEDVEALWTPIADQDDWAPLETKITQIREMGQAYRLTGGI